MCSFLTSIAKILCRLTESDETFQKRLAWAEQQVSAAAAPGLINCTIQDSSPEEAYTGLKHAVAALSPLVRNKLYGLPAEVLDYADLIVSNSVEQAMLKAVLIAGNLYACAGTCDLLVLHAQFIRIAAEAGCDSMYRGTFAACMLNGVM